MKTVDTPLCPGTSFFPISVNPALLTYGFYITKSDII